ncbi:EthD family reductase [Cumulibacter manganitolerans]|uniref:EthD family reductase n=1 Tax=Cumulibacter manganitolerans TaxID=1884992 RepID=UPI0012965C27|nr:EthD family reductase [Cumulibacter manganitolerans]
MSNSFFAVYKMPDDPAAFDEAYKGHTAIVEKLPGMTELRVNKVVNQVAGEPKLYLITEMAFGSVEDLQAALASDPGKESAADLQSWGGDKLISMLVTERLQ